MSFWNLNDGSQVDTKAEFEISGGDLPPIPANTGCIAAIEEAKWDEYDGDRYISLKWRVAKPVEYSNRVIYQKLKVYGTKSDKDPAATADKAKRMLGAINTNANGKLMQVQGEPTDMDLMGSLMGKMMAIKLQVWRIAKDSAGNMLPADEVKQGNWVSAVAPAKSQQPYAAQTVAPAAAEPAPQVQQDQAAQQLGEIPF